MSAERATRVRRAGALALTVALTACSWFTDFKTQPKYDPWESPNDSIPMRGNPQSSVSVFGSAAPGYAVSRAALPGTIDSMASIQNPVPADVMEFQMRISIREATDLAFVPAAFHKYAEPAGVPPLALPTSP